IKIGIVDERFPPDRKWEDDRAVAPLGSDGVEQFGVLRWHHIDDAFAVVGDERVPVDETPDPVLDSIGNASDNHAAVAVADEDNLPKAILDQVIDDRLCSLGEPDGPRISRTITLDRGGEGLVTSRPDQCCDWLQLLSRVPCAVNEDISRHVRSSGSSEYDEPALAIRESASA